MRNHNRHVHQISYHKPHTSMSRMKTRWVARMRRLRKTKIGKGWRNSAKLGTSASLRKAAGKNSANAVPPLRPKRETWPSSCPNLQPKDHTITPRRQKPPNRPQVEPPLVGEFQTTSDLTPWKRGESKDYTNTRRSVPPVKS